MRVLLLALLALSSLAVLNASPLPEDEDEWDEEYSDEAPRFGIGSIAKFSISQLAKEGAKQTVKESIKQAGKLTIKEGFKQGIKEGAKQAGKLLIKSTVQLTKQGLRVIKSGAIKLAKSQIVKQGKKFVIKVGKEALKEAVTVGSELAVNSAIGAIKNAIEGNGEPVEDQEIDIMDYLAHADICSCSSNHLCSCCAEIADYPKGCLTMKLEESLWAPKSNVIVQGDYDDTRVIRNRFPVNGAKRKCVTLDMQSGDKFTFCVSSFGRDKDGDKQYMCFDLEFNGQTIRKCIQQSKDLTLSMKTD
uniref:Venom protein family 2 protein 8 n=1 Tax=Lethocerus distinctifemur TaxID=280095 RepID=A0A2K8JLF2_9HEMI|nr:venom protein family 2 protein 8 [Lethocerus distinctifemur]